MMPSHNPQSWTEVRDSYVKMCFGFGYLYPEPQNLEIMLLQRPMQPS